MWFAAGGLKIQSDPSFVELVLDLIMVHFFDGLAQIPLCTNEVRPIVAPDL